MVASIPSRKERRSYRGLGIEARCMVMHSCMMVCNGDIYTIISMGYEQGLVSIEEIMYAVNSKTLTCACVKL